MHCVHYPLLVGTINVIKHLHLVSLSLQFCGSRHTAVRAPGCAAHEADCISLSLCMWTNMVYLMNDKFCSFYSECLLNFLKSSVVFDSIYMQWGGGGSFGLQGLNCFW